MTIRRLLATLGALALAVACSPDTAPDEGGDAEGVLRIYTTVTQDTVDAVLAGFEADHEGIDVEVFRAPTGEFNARVAAERRDGEIQADVFWLTDQLSMLQFDQDDLLASWDPEGVEVVPDEHRSDTFWGTRLLNLVTVAHLDQDPAPTSWWDHTDPSLRDGVAVPDPGFAGSAFAALGHLALDDEHGMAFYEALADNGAVQVNAPGEVVSGVAEGRFRAGMTLDRLAREAVEDGSPVQMIWPEPAAIAVASPIAVLDGAVNRRVAERFVAYVLSEPAQSAIAGTGWEPIRTDVDWPHDTGPTVTPDWETAFEQRDELLESYRALFGG